MLVSTPAAWSTPPSKNSGNDTSLDEATGDTTIALEKSIIINQKNKLAVSKLTLGTNPKTAMFAIDTKTDRNSFWPKAKVMDYYEFGTLNSAPENEPGPIVVTNGAGLGGRYTEYRKLSTSAESGTDIDEELQVWRWDNSYGVQYRDMTSGGADADHQAWSFGGTRTAMAAMPTGGTATYNGQFGSTAKTTGWVNTKDQRQTLDYNNLWQVTGTSAVTANFGANTVTGRLTPLKWRSIQTMNGATGAKTLVVDRTTPIIVDPADPSFDPHRLPPYLYDEIVLKGTITKDATKGNTVTGSAYVDEQEGWISNTSKNPFAGAFFGPTANEFTGIFNVESTQPDPYGGVFPINNDRRGSVQHSGVTNGQN
jgi:hypothetical protein